MWHDAAPMQNSKFMTPVPLPSPISVVAAEAARLLSISPRKLWELTKAGSIPSYKVGPRTLYRVADLNAWTERQVAASLTSARNA